MKKNPVIRCLVILLLLACLVPEIATARGIRFIRDAETENLIRIYATPIFRAAGLNPEAIDVYLINNSQLNAFVTGGQNMFLHTGLLMRAETPLQVIGVIAHETGHISGGHIVARKDEMKNAQTKLLLAYVLGAAVGVGSGRPDAGAAVLRGAQGAAVADLLAYTRGQESAADQAAVNLLNSTGQSPRGLLEFMEILKDQEALLSSRQDPYLRTHPLSQDRVNFLRQAVKQSPSADVPVPDSLQLMHDRMRAKLLGFIQPMKALRTFPENDQSIPARYARAIALHQRAQLNDALAEIDSLIAESPRDPYYLELKGQILFESGRIEAALTEYQAAVDILPSSPLLRQSLAQIQLELNDRQLNDEALKHLRYVTQREPRNIGAWRLTAIAQGRRGDKGMTALALAEQAIARNDAKQAVGQAQRAQQLLPEGSPGWLRAQDIETLAGRLRKRR